MSVTIVSACLRHGRGGSPTAVVDEAPLSDAQRRLVPVLAGTSHAVFMSVGDDGRGQPLVSLRFFTTGGELPACGHGTVAALAALTERAASTGGTEYHATLRTAGGRTFHGSGIRRDDGVHARFDPGPIELHEPLPDEREPVLAALGVTARALAPGACTATLGRRRLLVPVTSIAALTALAPDFGRLRDACDRFGLLGCYVHTAPTPAGRLAARMFAPSIGVPEDIANANSTACLAAHLARQGITDIAADMGDTVGSPATITATSQPGQSGPRIHVGGVARITDTHRLEPGRVS
ncbi:PhzF family phenazine biosynthesis protein [Polymorphospora lycopeni]|uniref:PhzF family phenazine biosynthesis protein n=1 Tax=Polymorphospora lycopeni TaxID=3140240 RepID=A0ABV5CXQ3_9ACTN